MFAMTALVLLALTLLLSSIVVAIAPTETVAVNCTDSTEGWWVTKLAFSDLFLRRPKITASNNKAVIAAQDDGRSGTVHRFLRESGPTVASSTYFFNQTIRGLAMSRANNRSYIVTGSNVLFVADDDSPNTSWNTTIVSPTATTASCSSVTCISSWDNIDIVAVWCSIGYSLGNGMTDYVSVWIKVFPTGASPFPSLSAVIVRLVPGAKSAQAVTDSVIVYLSTIAPPSTEYRSLNTSSFSIVSRAAPAAQLPPTPLPIGIMPYVINGTAFATIRNAMTITYAATLLTEIADQALAVPLNVTFESFSTNMLRGPTVPSVFSLPLNHANSVDKILEFCEDNSNISSSRSSSQITTFVRKSNISSLNYGIGAVTSDNFYGYIATNSVPGKIFQFSLSSSSDMSIVTTVDLGSSCGGVGAGITFEGHFYLLATWQRSLCQFNMTSMTVTGVLLLQQPQQIFQVHSFALVYLTFAFFFNRTHIMKFDLANSSTMKNLGVTNYSVTNPGIQLLSAVQYAGFAFVGTGPGACNGITKINLTTMLVVNFFGNGNIGGMYFKLQSDNLAFFQSDSGWGMLRFDLRTGTYTLHNREISCSVGTTLGNVALCGDTGLMIHFNRSTSSGPQVGSVSDFITGSFAFSSVTDGFAAAYFIAASPIAIHRYTAPKPCFLVTSVSSPLVFHATEQNVTIADLSSGLLKSTPFNDTFLITSCQCFGSYFCQVNMESLNGYYVFISGKARIFSGVSPFQSCWTGGVVPSNAQISAPSSICFSLSSAAPFVSQIYNVSEFAQSLVATVALESTFSKLCVTAGLLVVFYNNYQWFSVYNLSTLPLLTAPVNFTQKKFMFSSNLFCDPGWSTCVAEVNFGAEFAVFDLTRGQITLRGTVVIFESASNSIFDLPRLWYFDSIIGCLWTRTSLGVRRLNITSELIQNASYPPTIPTNMFSPTTSSIAIFSLTTRLMVGVLQTTQFSLYACSGSDLSSITLADSRSVSSASSMIFDKDLVMLTTGSALELFLVTETGLQVRLAHAVALSAYPLYFLSLTENSLLYVSSQNVSGRMPNMSIMSMGAGCLAIPDLLTVTKVTSSVRLLLQANSSADRKNFASGLFLNGTSFSYMDTSNTTQSGLPPWMTVSVKDDIRVTATVPVEWGQSELRIFCSQSSRRFLLLFRIASSLVARISQNGTRFSFVSPANVASVSVVSSDHRAGQFIVQSFGSVLADYDKELGVLSAFGTIAGLNTLFSKIRFSLTPGYETVPPTFMVLIDDNTNAVLNTTVTLSIFVLHLSPRPAVLPPFMCMSGSQCSYNIDVSLFANPDNLTLTVGVAWLVENETGPLPYWLSFDSFGQRLYGVAPLPESRNTSDRQEINQFTNTTKIVVSVSDGYLSAATNVTLTVFYSGVELIDRIPNATVKMGALFSIDAGQFFSSSSPISFSFAALPHADGAWLALRQSTLYGQAPSVLTKISVSITGRDALTAATQNFTITVFNLPPLLAKSVPRNVLCESGVLCEVMVTDLFADADDLILEYSASVSGLSLPSWLSFDAPRGRLYGIPPLPGRNLSDVKNINSYEGKVDVLITASDRYLSATTNVTLTVFYSGVELIDRIPNATVKMGALFSIDAGQFFSSSSPISFSFATLPLVDGSWLTLSQSVLYGISYVSRHVSVALTAADELTSCSQHFEITVRNNTAPMSNERLLKAFETVSNVPVTFVLDRTLFYDIDNDTLVYSALRSDGGPLPLFMQFTSDSRTLSLKPSGDDVGSYELLFLATDSVGLSANVTMTVTVKLSYIDLYLKVSEYVGIGLGALSAIATVIRFRGLLLNCFFSSSYLRREPPSEFMRTGLYHPSFLKNGKPIKSKAIVQVTCTAMRPASAFVLTKVLLPTYIQLWCRREKSAEELPVWLRFVGELPLLSVDREELASLDPRRVPRTWLVEFIGAHDCILDAFEFEDSRLLGGAEYRGGILPPAVQNDASVLEKVSVPPALIVSHVKVEVDGEDL
jgi:hypothetical protein